jgi:hypothetical protein
LIPGSRSAGKPVVTKLNDELSRSAEFDEELDDEALDRPTDEPVPFTVGSTHAG